MPGRRAEVAGHPHEPHHGLVDRSKELRSQLGTHLAIAPSGLVQLIACFAGKANRLGHRVGVAFNSFPMRCCLRPNAYHRPTST